ncbi:fimbrial protein [Raoultella sp. T31]|uniref:fimbrial protein n=1 Tax=Raoultella sp. T31 TaxID=2054594 RepID=UPI000C2907CF|nr:hypothetical protein CWM52_14790 [Raoultella sp. T31]
MTLMIKKTLLTAATVSLLALSPGIQAASDSATVNITATVVDNTCTPQWSMNGVDVAMGRVSLKDFGSDKIGATEAFTLNLAGCGSGATSVKVTASGVSDATDSSLFKNTETTEGVAATGVGVEIWGDSDQATKMAPDGSNSVMYPIANSKADMTFLARLKQSGATAPGAGAVKSVVTMIFDYQ